MLSPRYLAALLLLHTLPLTTFAAPRTCLVVGVSDGDTLKARCGAPGAFGEVKVRFNGINSPEKKQPFGERAKQAKSDLVYMKNIDLDRIKTDRYGRSVCKVMVAPASAASGPKTLDAGLAMITLGMAWWYRAYSREQTAQERGQCEFAETEAKAKRVGLWRDADPVASWAWRKSERED